ncbi:MAG: PilZ domain-containing protein [Oscillospiraceae bacterium]|nr:PilZ domain-containing protein [Oscillospiraceae bacterium]
MLSRERILKLDILTPDNTKILSANNRQFSIPIVTNHVTGQSETMLIIKGRDIPEVEHNTEISVITYMRSGERVKYPGFVSLSTEYQLNVLLRTARAQVMEERRRYYKVEADIRCVINTIERDGKHIALDRPATAKISDMNIGGVFLCFCDEQLLQGDLLQMSLALEDKLVDVPAEIIRVQFNAAGDPTGYGCRFLKVPPSLEETFARFVFNVQLDNLKREEEKD